MKLGRYPFFSKNTFLRNPISKNFGTNIEKIFDQKKVQEFRDNGYAVLPKVFSGKLIDELRAEIDSIINSTNPQEIKSIFDGVHYNKDKYFFESGDKIRFFLEKDAWDENGNLKYSLKDSLNKIGHALHDLNPKFRSFSYSNEIKYLIKMMGYISPIIAQSMLIFKNPRIGAEVIPHTDSTYIRTTPLSCGGIWVAFDDATKENGCLWGVPGSHKTPTNYFLKTKVDKEGNISSYYDPPESPKYDISKAVPLEVEKGSIVLLHGDLVHLSYPNTSPYQRNAYTLHFVESRNHQWEKDNWITRKDIPFYFLNDTPNRL